jgi:hypothetical protein
LRPATWSVRIVGLGHLLAAALLFDDGMKFKFEANQDKPAKYRRIVLKFARIRLELLQRCDSFSRYLP